MSKYPAAVQRPVDRYQSGDLHVAMTARRVVAHTAVSADTPSMHSFFNVSGRATPHFYFGRDGECEQYINTGFRSSAVLDGNHDCITFESWDGFPGEWSGGMAPPWTDAQVDAIAHLCAWCNTEHGIPLVQLPSSRPGTEGIGWHRQGIDGNFPSSGLLSGRVDGGEHWSESFGKTCPTDRRIEQIPPGHHPPSNRDREWRRHAHCGRPAQGKDQPERRDCRRRAAGRAAHGGRLRDIPQETSRA
jgi:hypothetical protein